MKKRNVFLTSLVDGCIMLTMVVGLASCGDSKQDPKDTAEEHNEAKFDDKKSESDAQFLVEAAEINLTEIKLGQLAATNAMNAEVKDLGKMMDEQHSKAQQDLAALASKKTMTIPTAITSDGQAEYNKLAEKNGKDFDKEFCDKMVDGHKAAIEKFEKAAADCTDPDIKAWASDMLPSLRTHLDHAKTCQDKMKSM